MAHRSGKLQMESNNKRRARKGNFSHPEVQFLVDMIASRKHIIENKRTDSVTNSEKTKAWAEICTVFNAYSPNCYRDVKSLRSKYDQLKMDAKRKMAQMKWPGQSCGIEFLPHEDKIVSMLTGVMEGEYMSDEHSYMEPLTEIKSIEDAKPILGINSPEVSFHEHTGEDDNVREPSTSREVEESINFINLQKEQATKEHELRMVELQLRIKVQEKELERLDIVIRKEKLEIEKLENK